MKRILILTIISIFFWSCRGQSNSDTISPHDQVCKGLITSITSYNYEKAVEAMDEIVLNKIPKDTLKSAMARLASTLKDEFKGEITKVTFLTSEKTLLNELPAIFVIYKLESEKLFGFYYFYLNEKSNKVMLISRFTKVEPKRN